MTFRVYRECENSGIDWFGAVPCSWRVQRLKHVVIPSRPITYGIVQAGENVPDGIPYIRPADMTDESGVKVEDSLLRTSQEIASAYRRSSISAGDIVCSIGPSFGKLMMVPPSLEGANLTQGTARVAVAIEHVVRFIFWALRSVESYQQWESSVGGATFRALNLGPLTETFLCVPSWAEQTQIARFLDHETARIDALIEEQQRLIELLREKRQAVISHAVTKGLDPTVPMKDSGVEWLGEVPAHWRSVKVKRLFTQSKRQGYADMEVLSVYRDYGVVQKNSRDDNNNKTPEDLSLYQLVMEGDLVVNKMKAWQGSLGVSEYQGITSPDYVVYSPSHGEMPRFIHYLLRASHMPRVYLSISNGIRPSQWRIEPEKFEQVEVFLPGKAEQLDIVAYLEAQIIKINELMLCCEQAIELFSERRSALISAAVTGKIDVRGWQPPILKSTQHRKAVEA